MTEGDAALAARDYKQAIANYLAVEKTDPSVCPKLAEAYFRDQEEVRAFLSYLEGIEKLPRPATPHQIDPEETPHYKKALEIYFDHAGSSAVKEQAMRLSNEFEALIEEHPQYTRIKFLVAASKANLGFFDQFFNLFYQTETLDPDHWLSAKIRGLLHIKLFERLSDPTARQFHQRAAHLLLKEALQKSVAANEVDMALYKMVIASAPEEDKETLVVLVKQLIAGKEPVPRHDLAFYIRILIDRHERDLAQSFINRAKEWYGYSRAVMIAEQHLQEAGGE